MKAIKPGDHPKIVVQDLSEDLLSVFSGLPLIDRYDVYQHLMTYWSETMQDDVYMIIGDGWKEANKLRLIEDKKSKEQPDLVIDKKKFKAELIPPSLIIAQYFRKEKTDLDKAESDLAAAMQALEEMQEEHGGDEGFLSDLMNEKGKIPKASVIDRLKEIKKDKGAEEERKVLTAYLDLVEKESKANSAVKDLQKALDLKVAGKYSKLTEDEIKTLVVEDKWLATLESDVQTELDRISQALTGRIRQLAERYATPLPKLEEEAEALSARVEGHLKKMGFAW
jgi:type I restriction enzyme M protein